MKRIHYIGIIIILIVLVGLFIASPFSPLNKTSINGHSIKLPTGYTVQKSEESTLKMSNGTDTIIIFSLKQEPEKAIKSYHKKYDKKFNITEENMTLGNNSEKIIKTSAKNETTQIYKYWFTKNNENYNIQTNSSLTGTEDIIASLISSL